MVRNITKVIESTTSPEQLDAQWIDISTEPAVLKAYSEGEWKPISGKTPTSYVKTVNNIAPDDNGNVNIQGGEGTTDYNELTNKPQIGGVELSGNKTAAQLGLQPHDVFARMTNPYKTTFTEVQAAFNAGKQVYIEYTPPRSHPGTYVRMKLASEYGSAAFYFVAIEGNKKYTTTLYNNDTWDPVTVVTLATSTDLEDKQDVINLDNKLSYSFLSDTPAIPTTLAGLSDDSTHRVVTDTEKSTWNNKATTTDVVTQSASVAIKPNKITHLGTITGSVNITLEAGETSKAAIYDFIFTTDANISSITWATGITWEKKETPVIKANTTYEVCISENLAVITEF